MTERTFSPRELNIAHTKACTLTDYCEICDDNMETDVDLFAYSFKHSRMFRVCAAHAKSANGFSNDYLILRPLPGYQHS